MQMFSAKNRFCITLLVQRPGLLHHIVRKIRCLHQIVGSKTDVLPQMGQQNSRPCQVRNEWGYAIDWFNVVAYTKNNFSGAPQWCKNDTFLHRTWCKLWCKNFGFCTKMVQKQGANCTSFCTTFSTTLGCKHFLLGGSERGGKTPSVSTPKNPLTVTPSF